MASGGHDPALGMVARDMGLVLASLDDLTITRQRDGNDFIFLHGSGKPVKDKRAIARLRALAVPPAYEDVRLAADSRAHLQAVGRDAAGRLQYRYHPKWDDVRESRKAERLTSVLGALPDIREAVSRDLSRPRLDRRKALATAVALLDATHMRVGCEEYARKNKSFGISTLMRRHVECTSGKIILDFRGKGGKSITCEVNSPRLARAVGRMSDLKGGRLLKYRDQNGRIRSVGAHDINAYLAEIAGVPVSAKDLRALGACAAAAEQLVSIDPAESEARQKRQIAGVMKHVSERLSNTPAIVRKSYVHAVVVRGFVSGKLREAFRSSRSRPGMRRVERTLGVLLEKR